MNSQSQACFGNTFCAVFSEENLCTENRCGKLKYSLFVSQLWVRRGHRTDVQCSKGDGFSSLPIFLSLVAIFCLLCPFPRHISADDERGWPHSNQNELIRCNSLILWFHSYWIQCFTGTLCGKAWRLGVTEAQRRRRKYCDEICRSKKIIIKKRKWNKRLEK